MSESMDLKETAVSEPEEIEALKAEEKEKLAAAEEAYSRKTAVNQNEETAGQEVDEPPRSSGRGKTPWMPGLLLIALGVIFLLNNITGFALHNWWALFILIPAFSQFSKAADLLRSEGEFTGKVWSALGGGTILCLVAAAFLFNLNWNLIWPAFLIIGGLGIFLGALGR
ncbi:MAG: hypothetical protein ACK2T4_07255 [Candidatus Promineifilaceae bacterium]|jgi:hypothetical protein